MNPNAIPRILDANSNRAREAMRVMEEYARFILNDSSLSKDIKNLRHDLHSIILQLPSGLLEAHRDTPNDVGTAHSTIAEDTRTNASNVVIAAGKRLSEALRSLEEYSKVINPDIARQFKAVRYRGYTIEKSLHNRIGSHVFANGIQWKLCVLLTRSLCSESPEFVLDSIINAGVDCIQIREKEMSDRNLINWATLVIAQCKTQNINVIINDRSDIALAVGADGVHLGQDDLSVQEVRRIAGRQLIVGVSTSNIDEAKNAIESGADYCGVGPMFPTTTKDKPILSGPAYLAEYLTHFDTPHLAIGGITPDNIAELCNAGACGAAVSGAICNATDPGSVVTQLLQTMKES